MTLAGTNVLLVGQNFRRAQTLTERLHRLKFRCHFAPNARTATDFAASHPVDLVLSNTHLPDSSGYCMLMKLSSLPVSAFLCFPVENSCLWLPALNDGKRCLGLPALRPPEFAKALERMATLLPA
jgi:response regulator RpfG family c-di-GMP phosphodiesterase